MIFTEFNFIKFAKYINIKLNINNKLNFIMKKIEAIIRKSKYRTLKEALHEVGVNFFSYWDVTGIGNEKEGHVYRGVSYSTSDIQRRHISIVVNDDFEEVTGEVGDGKIFVSDINETYRIRTGEKGGQTLK